MPLLDVRNLHVRYGNVPVLKGVNISLHAHQKAALVGESGSGKTSVAYALTSLLPRCAIREGEATFDGADLFFHINKIRSSGIGMVFQDPGTFLNPTMRIGRQLAETTLSKSAMIHLLLTLRLSSPEKLLRQYPHELSGGMQQRILIAMALAKAPKLLIADEPTSALDEATQQELIPLFQNHKGALLLITHDLSFARRIADTLFIMRNGEIVESGEAAKITCHPKHPYTKALLQC